MGYFVSTKKFNISSEVTQICNIFRKQIFKVRIWNKPAKFYRAIPKKLKNWTIKSCMHICKFKNFINIHIANKQWDDCLPTGRHRTVGKLIKFFWILNIWYIEIKYQRRTLTTLFRIAWVCWLLNLYNQTQFLLTR